MQLRCTYILYTAQRSGAATCNEAGCFCVQVKKKNIFCFRVQTCDLSDTQLFVLRRVDLLLSSSGVVGLTLCCAVRTVGTTLPVSNSGNSNCGCEETRNKTFPGLLSAASRTAPNEKRTYDADQRCKSTHATKNYTKKYKI